MNNYWKQRSVDLENLLQDKTTATVVEINKLYSEASKIIVSKMNKIFETYRKGGRIDSEHALQLLSTEITAQQRQELLEALKKTADKKVRREIISMLDAPAYADRISRLQALQDIIRAEALKLGVAEENLVTSRLKDVAKTSYYRTIFNDQKKTGKVYDFSTISDRRLQAMLAHKWSGSNYSSRIWKNNDKFVKKLQQTIEVGCLTGLSLKELEEHIIDDCIGATSDEGQRFCASRLIRTEVNYFANQGMLMGYKEAGIEKYLFLATLDLKTSEICRKLDLKSFSVSEAEAGVNLPPMHPFCRSVTVPDTGSRTGTRWARNPITGQSMTVPADMTYQQWYDKYIRNNPEAVSKEKAIGNTNSDNQQYERYNSVLRDLSPKSLEDFVAIKYNDIDKWNELKYQYRTVNRYEVDGDVSAEKIIQLDNAAYYTKKTGFDYSSFSGKEKRKIKNNISNGGNAAVMEFENNVYFSHSRFGVLGSFEHSLYKGEYPTVTLTKDRIFEVKDLGDGIPRQYDTEAKFLEFVASQKSVDETFSVTILSEKHICESCQSVLEQFKTMYPNATVNIISGKRGYNSSAEGLHTWKRRKKVNDI